MKRRFLALFLVIPSLQAACLPEEFSPSSLKLNDNAREIELAVDDFDVSMRRLIPGDLRLTVQMDVLNPRTNAEIRKDGSDVVIQVMGGMINHPTMNPDVMKLLLCHEVGHLLGGPPLKARGGWSSTEGQSDYYSSADCAKHFDFDEARFFDAAERLTSIYAAVTREVAPRLGQCEERIAERTNYGYPTVQCRLDTLVAGWNRQERPRCWFRP